MYYFCFRRPRGEHHLARQDLCWDPPGLHQTHQPVVSTQVTSIRCEMRCYQHLAYWSLKWTNCFTAIYCDDLDAFHFPYKSDIYFGFKSCPLFV